jgi:hypothetical protein
MTEHYTLEMALMDFIPNIAFLTGAFFLVRLVLRERGTRCGRMLMAGSVFIFMGGMLKATWKLTMAISEGQTNIIWMSEQQFVLLAIGFTGMCVSIILLARDYSAKKKSVPPLLAIAPWKIPLLAIMTLAEFGALGILTFISFRRSVRLSGALFIVAALCILGMAGMASGTQTVDRQWVEQSVNVIGQGSFAVACFWLERQSRLKTLGGNC